MGCSRRSQKSTSNIKLIFMLFIFLRSTPIYHFFLRLSFAKDPSINPRTPTRLTVCHWFCFRARLLGREITFNPSWREPHENLIISSIILIHDRIRIWKRLFLYKTRDRHRLFFECLTNRNPKKKKDILPVLLSLQWRVSHMASLKSCFSPLTHNERPFDLTI